MFETNLPLLFRLLIFHAGSVWIGEQRFYEALIERQKKLILVVDME